jgi:hypothetical protein
MKTRELASYALNVLFFLAAIYMWHHPHRDRSLSLFSSETSKIYDSQSHTSKLHVTDEYYKPITTDIFITTATVWNNGSEAIEATDIRRPLCLKFDNAERILDKGIIRSNDKGSAAFDIKESQCSNSETPAVAIDWKHFDPGYAAKFQVIYAAKAPSNVTSDADVMGISSIPWRVSGSGAEKVSLIASMLVALASLGSLLIAGKTGFLVRHPAWSFVFSSASAVAIMLVVYFVAGPVSPPF